MSYRLIQGDALAMKTIRVRGDIAWALCGRPSYVVELYQEGRQPMAETRSRLWEVQITYTATVYAWAPTADEAEVAVDDQMAVDEAIEDDRYAYAVTCRPRAPGTIVHGDERPAGDLWDVQEGLRLEDEQRTAIEALQEKLPL